MSSAPELDEEIVIIRPDYVWDTRSPFNEFIDQTKPENQLYWLTILTLKNSLSIWENEKDRNTSSEQLFGKRYNKIWVSYKKSIGKKHGKEVIPDVNTAIKTLKNSEVHLTEVSIISYFRKFEQFMHCLTLNYLLTKLECTDEGLNDSEKKLARQYYPSSQRSPAIRTILNSITDFKNTLEKIPNTSINPVNLEPEDAPKIKDFNAHTCVNFWNNWRDRLVHNEGLINDQFYNDHREFWMFLKKYYHHIPDLRRNERIKLNHAVYSLFTTTLYKAGLELRLLVTELSGDKRGHVNAPGPRTPGGKVDSDKMPKENPKMFIEGYTHKPSFRCTIDPEYMKSKIEQVQLKSKLIKRAISKEKAIEALNKMPNEFKMEALLEKIVLLDRGGKGV